jgi:hypothetical protein
MKPRGVSTAIAALALFTAGAAPGQDGGAAILGTLTLGDCRLDLRPDGGFSLRRGERVLIRNARLTVAGENWRGSVNQGSLNATAGFPRRDGEAYAWRGTVVEPVAGVTWTLEQLVEPTAGGARLLYTATPERDSAISEVCVFLDLPVAEWSGKPLLLWPSEEGTFPAQRPPARHFLSGATRRAALGPAGPERLGLAFETPTLCTAQDAREFGSDCYQLYPRLQVGRAVRAGTPYRLGITLVPGDTTLLTLPRLTLESRGEPGLAQISAAPGPVPQYRRFEVSFQASGTWTNPYDPAQVAVDAVFRTPDQREVVMPAFFFQDYDRADLAGAEILMPKGNPGWEVRFAPTTPGLYRWSLRLTNQGRTITSPEDSFTCAAAPDQHGYLRVSPTNPYYLEFDDGTPFFGVGMNIATLDGGLLTSAERWYTRLAEAGGNLVRSWWCAAGTDLESTASSRPDQGLGRYRQEDCWRLDYLITLSERLGIRMMCCIETQQALRRDAWWGRFTYNQANGGPLQAPAEFFTEATARQLFRNRLRYIVARWGYSTSVYAWQFWNEVSACNDFQPQPVADWHREMAVYLRGIDPARHPIHSNFGNLDGYREVDGLPEMEVISTNIYSRRDMAQTGAWATRYLTAHYRKPFLLTEYGVGHHGGWVSEDPTGIIVHNGLWGPLMNGSAGTGMPWGWGGWIDTQDMYHYWKPVAEIVAGVPFSKRTWRPLQVVSLEFRESARAPYYADVFIEGWPRNYSFTLCPPARPPVFAVTAEGELPAEESLTAMLRAGERQTLAATFPVDGTLVVHVPEISESGEPLLRVEIDGTQALSQALPRGPGKPWEYWASFPVPVAAGARNLTIANAGSGALWTAYELRNYRRRTGPDLDAEGLLCDDYILLWLRQPQFIWLCQREGRQPPAQPEGLLTLDGVAAGTYAVTWIETTTGEHLPGPPTVSAAAAGRLALPTPPITRSAVARLVRLPPQP